MEFSIFTFPFEQIGWGLRQLSLSGAIGNIFAIVLFVLLGLIPCIAGVVLKKKGKWCKVDFLLPVISIFLFVMLYFMINPGLIAGPVSGSGKLLFCGSFYSVLVGYLVLRVLEKCVAMGTKELQKGLRVLLYVVMLIFGYSIVVECFYNLPQAIRTLQEGNSAVLEGWFNGEADLTMTYIFLVLQSLVKVLPYVLDIVILFISVRAVDELLVDAYSDKAVAAVKKIADLAPRTLAVIVISNVIFNVAQLIFRNALYQIQIDINIPVFSILFIMAILVMARFVRENQKLKQDNELFI